MVLLYLLSPGMESWDVGTTTMLAGVIVPVRPNEWELVVVSVGDCKVLACHHRISVLPFTFPYPAIFVP